MLYSTPTRTAAALANPQPLTGGILLRENHRFGGTTGVSIGNRSYGFKPAFMDRVTGQIYLSRFGDGRPAPVHVLDGLPKELVIQRSASGRVIKVRGSVIAGFVKDGQFLTREEDTAAPCGVQEVYDGHTYPR